MKIFPDILQEIFYEGVTAFFAGLDEEALGTLPPEDFSGVGEDDPRMAKFHPFIGEILDTATGKKYSVKHYWAHYESTERWDTESMQMVQFSSLQPYMYAAHWCGCHRIDSIECANAGVSIEASEAGEKEDVDGYCPDGRLIVLSLTHPSLPGVCLMREKKATDGNQSKV
jgi:hypothetical protein